MRHIRRRSGFSLWGMFGLLAVVVLAAAVLIPLLLTPSPAYRAQCQSNLKQLGLAIFQYQQDWDNKFPQERVKDAAIDADNPLGWADAVLSYTKSPELFWCPLQIKNGARDRAEKKPTDRDYTDYFYNRRLSGLSIEQYQAPIPHTILLGEGNDGTDAANARYAMSTLPEVWRVDKTSPSHRHLERGANYAFADGHVKWLKPAEVTAKKPDGSTPTFALR